MKLRIGFYVCHCGINIAGKVNVEAVADYVRGLRDVVVARDYKFMCSDPGQEMIVQDIRDHNLNRVVVASCSPAPARENFYGRLQTSGPQSLLFPDGFGAGAGFLGHRRSGPGHGQGQKPGRGRSVQSPAAPEPQRPPVQGPPGRHDRGRGHCRHPGCAGRRAHPATRRTWSSATRPSAGNMLQFDKTFPTLDCAACIGTPKMVEVAQEPNIELLSYSEVTEVSGYIGNFTVKVLKKPRYITEGVCTGCGECATVCPVSMPSEWDEGLADRKAVYRPFPQAVPITYCIDKARSRTLHHHLPGRDKRAGICADDRPGQVPSGPWKSSWSGCLCPGVLGRVCPPPPAKPSADGPTWTRPCPSVTSSALGRRPG